MELQRRLAQFFVQLFGILMQSFSTVANILVVSVLAAVLVATSCVCMEI